MTSNQVDTAMQNSLLVRIISLASSGRIQLEAPKISTSIKKKDLQAMQILPLKDMAFAKFARDSDYLEAAASALMLEKRHLIPLILSGRFTQNPAAQVLIKISFNDFSNINVKEILNVRIPAYQRYFIAYLIYKHNHQSDRAKKMLNMAMAISSLITLLIYGLAALIIVSVIVGLYLLFKRMVFVPPQPPQKRPGGLRSFFAVYFAFGTVLISYGILIAPYIGKLHIPWSIRIILSESIIILAALISVYIWGRDLEEHRFKDLLGLNFRPQIDAIAWLKMVIVLYAAGFGGMLWSSWATPRSDTVPWSGAIPVVISGNATDIVVLVIVAVMIAPVIEELLFRGFLFRRLKRSLSSESAAWLSAVAFGFIHLNPATFVPITLIGYILARSYETSKSIIVPITLHAIWNLTISTVMILILARP